jgi:hypothetical protein
MRLKTVAYLSGKLLLVLTSTVIHGSESKETYDHILLSYDSGSSETCLVSQLGKLLLVLASKVILGSDFLRTHESGSHSTHLNLLFKAKFNYRIS